MHSVQFPRSLIAKLSFCESAQIDIDDDEEKGAEAQVDTKRRNGRYLPVSANWECTLS